MRILDIDSNKKIDNVMILLTKKEIIQLIGYSKQLIDNPSADHHHLSITICIYDHENIDNFNPRVQKLIRDDE
jgi:hypothetical protein